MRINHNVTAMNTANNLYNVNASQAKVLEKLGSGQRINKASDDAAGIAISEKMRGEVAVLKQQKANNQDLLAFSNAQDGALNEISNILVNIQQLITQSGDKATGSAAETGSLMMNSTAIANIGSTITALQKAASKFLEGNMNGMSLLSTKQIGNIIGSNGATTAVLNGIAGLTSTDSLAKVQTLVDNLNTLRAAIGAEANRAESTIRNLATQIENLTDAESRIRDTDMAETTVEFQKNNILNNAATSMLAQANTQPQSVLQLLR